MVTTRPSWLVKLNQRRNVYFIKNITDYPKRVIIQPDHLGQEVKALRDAGCQL